MALDLLDHIQEKIDRCHRSMGDFLQSVEPLVQPGTFHIINSKGFPVVHVTKEVKFRMHKLTLLLKTCQETFEELSQWIDWTRKTDNSPKPF